MKENSTKDSSHEFRIRHSRGGFYFGIFLIILGVLFLLQNLGILSTDWGKFWPLLIIALGTAIFFSR